MKAKLKNLKNNEKFLINQMVKGLLMHTDFNQPDSSSNPSSAHEYSIPVKSLGILYKSVLAYNLDVLDVLKKSSKEKVCRSTIAKQSYQQGG